MNFKLGLEFLQLINHGCPYIGICNVNFALLRSECHVFLISCQPWFWFETTFVIMKSPKWNDLSKACTFLVPNEPVIFHYGFRNELTGKRNNAEPKVKLIQIWGSNLSQLAEVTIMKSQRQNSIEIIHQYFSHCHKIRTTPRWVLITF